MLTSLCAFSQEDSSKKDSFNLLKIKKGCFYPVCNPKSLNVENCDHAEKLQTAPFEFPSTLRFAETPGIREASSFKKNFLFGISWSASFTERASSKNHRWTPHQLDDQKPINPLSVSKFIPLSTNFSTQKTPAS